MAKAQTSPTWTVVTVQLHEILEDSSECIVSFIFVENPFIN